MAGLEINKYKYKKNLAKLIEYYFPTFTNFIIIYLHFTYTSQIMTTLTHIEIKFGSSYTMCPITLWEMDGETVETVSDFICWGSKITADGDCSQEIKRCLLLGRKVMTNLDGILKSRDITLPTNVRLVKAMVFLVVMCGCNSWTIKKAEYQRIDTFDLWC